MDLPRRPSSHPPQKPALDAARGTFREALAALRNLSTLVRSRNVGPRAILDLVPDVRASCARVAQAGGEVLRVIETELDGTATAELGKFLADCCERLNAELQDAEQ